MKTEIFAASGLPEIETSVPSFLWEDPARVAAEAYRAVEEGRPVYIPGIPNNVIVTMAKFVPRAILRERTRVLHGRAHLNLFSLPGRPKVNAPPGKHAALVTGATAGIGRSFCDALAREGFDVVMVARREDLLRRAAEEIAKNHGVKTHTIVADLTDPASIERIRAEADRLGWPIDVLVNNAGFPVTELFHRMDWPQVDGILQLYVKAVVALTHIFVPGMVARGWGRVINVASTAGFEPGSYRSSLYSSSKAFVIAFTESISHELEGTGVSATALCPGFTRTEWFEKNKLKNDYVPGVFWMSSDHVASEGLQDAMRSVPVTIVATPLLKAFITMLNMAPRRALGRYISNKRKAQMTQTS
jgi:short-subunit dehydrogenase